MGVRLYRTAKIAMQSLYQVKHSSQMRIVTITGCERPRKNKKSSGKIARAFLQYFNRLRFLAIARNDKLELIKSENLSAS
jgi:hypothetical protein